MLHGSKPQAWLLAMADYATASHVDPSLTSDRTVANLFQRPPVRGGTRA